MRIKVKHICGQCGNSFATERAYIGHMCPALGRTPENTEATTLSKTKVASSLLEEKILVAVQKARVAKKQYNV